MEIDSQTFTNVQLIQELADRIIPMVESSQSSILVADTSPFLEILTHVIANELKMKWSTINVDLGILKIDPDFGAVNTVCYLTLHQKGIHELTSISEYLGNKCAVLKVISIMPIGYPNNSLDFNVNATVTRA